MSAHPRTIRPILADFSKVIICKNPRVRLIPVKFHNVKGLPMIDRKHHKIVFAFFMALLMSCIMSFVISVFNVGFVNNIVYVWLKAWAFAFAVAFPTITVVSPIVHKLVNAVLKA